VEDEDWVQPLVALWWVEALRGVVDARLRGNDSERSVQDLQASLGMPRIRLNGVRFGNLNTRDDLDAAGASLPAPHP
jgi:molybdopterin-guanine dinucleotide biosynthesis protein A